ncbi:MAG: hypothetical protein WBW69_17870 [Candidatus Korobacteraceae bacterium]
MGFFSRWSKFRKLIKISRCVGAWSAPGATTESALVSGNTAQSLQELLRLIESDQDCAAVLRKYKATSTTLEELFFELEHAGADHWAKGVYIPCIAIADERTLDYLLRVRARTCRAIGKTVAGLIVGFYDRDEPLFPPPFEHDGERLTTPPYNDF